MWRFELASTSSTWDEHAEGWDGNPAVRAYASAAFESLTNLCDQRGFRLSGSWVCDFGCGTGLLTEKLSPQCESVLAVDSSPKMLEVLDEKLARLGMSNVRTTQSLPGTAATDSFDLIVCSSVCAFLEDYPATLRMIAGLLRPGGSFVQWDWELDPSSDEPFGLTRTEIADALSGAGLQAIEVGVAFDVDFEGERMRPLIGVGRAPE